jgi:hypothetical protein
MKNLITLLAMFLAVALRPAVANTPDTNQTKPAATAPIIIPQVINVVAKKIDTVDKRHNGARRIAYAGDLIMVRLIHAQEFLNQRPLDKSKLILYAEGMELNGISSDVFNNINKNALQGVDSIWIPFKLARDTSTKQAWDYLYRITRWDKTHLRVHISMGWEGMFPVQVTSKDYNNTQIEIVFFQQWAFIAWLLLYIAIVGIFLYLAIRSDMLRDCDDGPYSLAQAQLAFWTILIIGSFIYTLILTDITSSLNSSILFLLGISITTNGTAVFIDYYKKKDRDTLKPKVSKGFWRDILGDGDTIVVQRVQNAAWTLVLGLYLIYYTISNKTLPTYPDTLLYLTGISSLAYVAGKPAENKKPAGNVNPNNNPPPQQPPGNVNAPPAN